MNFNNPLLYLFIILAYFTARSVTYEAILGGELAYPHTFRYLVSILEVDVGHICGGAIIGERFVLSAAHCFINPDNTFRSKDVYALAGTSDVMKLSSPSVNLKVLKIYVPHTYNAANINSIGDLAVLKLEKSLEIVMHVNMKQAIVEKTEKEYDGQKVAIAGWGWNEINSDHYGRRTDSLLRFATADVMSNHECKQEHPDIEIFAEYLCAKVEQHEHEIRGVCDGDDGGPLVHDRTIIGVLSKYPHNCTERASPAIYTRVSYYSRFIRNVKLGRETKFMRTHELYPS